MRNVRSFTIDLLRWERFHKGLNAYDTILLGALMYMVENADAHIEVDGVRYAKVTAEDLYAEFGMIKNNGEEYLPYYIRRLVNIRLIRVLKDKRIKKNTWYISIPQRYLYASYMTCTKEEVSQ